jgi:two-component system, NtrC family, response regulator HydG
MKKILVIDDDTDICLLLNRFLTKNGYQVEIAHKGKDGLRSLDVFKPDLILTDFRLGDIDGGELLLKIKEKHPNLPVIIITGYSDIKIAVSVMRQGAFDYITKPLFPDEILLTVKKAIEHLPSQSSEMQDVTVSSHKSSRKENANGYIFGNSEVSQKIIKQINLVAPTNFSVIIYGETGAGKEAIAQEIHKCSKRHNQPFVAMDCGAISKELAGSELFGHEKGSFTGALNQKIGHFELANGGTLFLDEVANLSYEVQVSLLRVVQERKVKRIGGNKEIAIDVRIIVASNEKLWESAKNGKFREDLYHRFNEFSLDIPALRDRKDDIMTFASYFLENTNQELEKNVQGFSQEVVDCFKTYPWYGNLRELKNVIKRATLLTEGNTIETTALPFELAHHQKILFAEEPEPTVSKHNTEQSQQVDENLKSASSKAEFEMILKVLKQVNFNKTKAAQMLNIDRKTLYNKMKGFDL